MSDDIGQSVRDRLANTSQVMSIVKEPDKILSDALPATFQPPGILVYVTGVTTYEDLNSSSRCGPAQVEVFAYGRDRKESNELAKAIRDSALAANLQGEIHGMDWREVSLVAGPSEVIDRTTEGSDQFRKLTQQTFSIWASPL